ncbi:DUF1192 domain-containing protein [Peteryoungia desertarenae]|uniref:DUF1192 domain-containing protein n=1 Tax=Peteryoungia desertarenae TaxID=1813451 RepID=A0ABX6QHL1_9HYPH|nr:DUF1192 domain-containing protein [Peteryoungia desertarenae]QLF68076.1 DUF1192 domain-containing protein [Peteryoungia desertarenae]
MMLDEENKRRPTAHEIGCDLSAISADELRARIALLNAEISRINDEIVRKELGRKAADNLFGPKV